MNGGIDWKALRVAALRSLRRSIYVIVIYFAFMFLMLAIGPPASPSP